MTSANTAEVSAEHAIWPQDPQFDLALAGGVTSMHLLPGSANLFGGRGVTVKNAPIRGQNRVRVRVQIDSTCRDEWIAEMQPGGQHPLADSDLYAHRG